MRYLSYFCLGKGGYMWQLQYLLIGFYEEQFTFSTSFKIYARGLVVAIVRVIGLWEALVEQNDERVTALAQRACNLLLAFRDGCGDMYHAFLGFCYARSFLRIDLLLG